MSDVDRFQRAGNYVLGLMDDAERARAERDLEQDDAFRAAVTALAARIRQADREIAARQPADPGWAAVSAGLAALPQMRGRFAAESGRPDIAGAADADRRPSPDRRLVVAAVAIVALTAVFALGVLAGRATADQPAKISSMASPQKHAG